MPMSTNFLNNQFELNLSWERDEVRFRFRLPIVEKFRYSRNLNRELNLFIVSGVALLDGAS